MSVAAAGVTVDESVYARVQPLRLPNSRHPGTGLFKVRVGLDELMGLSADGIRRLAAAPRPFDPPAVRVGDLIGELSHDWERSAAAVGRRAADAADRAAGGGPGRLNRLTLEFVAGGFDFGSRHRRLYSAARNLAEFGCPPRLAYALLMPAALDTGLTPADAGRQIDCGLAGSPPAEGG